MKNKDRHTEGWERVMAVMNHYGLNKNSFSVKIGMSNSMTIGRIINEKRKPIPATLNKIADSCPEINRDWLLTGEGEMLKSKPSVVDAVEGVSHVMIRDDAWQVIKDQAASLRTKDEQMAEVIALLKEQIKKGESLAEGHGHAAQGEAALG